MRTAIYYRVSTDNQEAEGTSLQTQCEACLSYCQDKAYDVRYRFSEAYSGLTLDRPKLNELRERVRAGDIDCIVVYCLDRFSRDPTHGVILIQELEKHNVTLEAVTEDVDNSDLGKLISYIRGYASKLEAEKIRERTMRGKRARIKSGKLPSGRGVLFGYDYDKDTGRNIANNNLDTVRIMGLWVLNEGVALNEVCRRLMYKGVPAPKGGLMWGRSTVGRILRNPAYAGKSYASRTVTVENKRITQSSDKWLEVPDAVDKPAFTSEEWQGIQHQLDRNRELSPRNQKLEYLLKGRVYCKECRQKCYGVPMHGKPYYRCRGRSKLLSIRPCNALTTNAEWLDSTVWSEVEKVLKNPEVMLAELYNQVQTGENIVHLEEQLVQLEKQMETQEEALDRYLRMYGAGLYTYERLEKEVTRTKAEQEKMLAQRTELQQRLSDIRNQSINADRVRQLLDHMASRIENASNADKRLALDALDIKVWVDNSLVNIEGSIPCTDMEIAYQHP